MLEDEIKKYYDAMTPSDETRNALIAKVRTQKKRQALIRLVYECLGSAAACLLFAFRINKLRIPKDSSLPDNKMIGTILSDPSGYLIAGMLLAVLILVFVVVYKKKLARIDDNKDDHE